MLEQSALILRDGDYEEPGKPWFSNLKDARVQDWNDANVVIYIDAYGRPFVVKNKFGKTQGIDLYQEPAKSETYPGGRR